MQLKNLECQLAMAQLKRYLGGAKLSDEALEALESHLVECAQCQVAVQMQRQQTAEGPKTTLTHAVVETPAPTTPEPSTPQKSKLSLPKFSLKGNAKTLTLSIALGLVLITMSALANDPTKLFGERMMKAGQKLPAATTPNKATKPPTSSVQTPQPAQVTPTSTATVKVDTPAPTNLTPLRRESTLKRSTVRPRTKRTARVARPVRAAAKRPSVKPKSTPQPKAQPGIRVYDESGRAVN